MGNPCIGEFAENQRGVVAPEGKGVGEHDVDVRRAGALRNEIEVALGIRCLVVNRRRNEVLMDRQHRHHPFDGAGGPQGMADHGLGRTDRYLVSPPPKNGLDSFGFRQIIGRCARAVGIDVIHRLRRNTGIFQGAPHRERSPRPFGVRSGHMVGIAADTVTQDLSVNMGSPLPGMRQRLQDQDTGAFAVEKALGGFYQTACSTPDPRPAER